MLGVGQNRFLDFLYIKDCLQLRHSLLKGSLFQRAYEDACQIAHSVGHSRVELTSAKLIDRIGQQVRNVLCGSKRKDDVGDVFPRSLLTALNVMALIRLRPGLDTPHSMPIARF